MIRRGVDSYHKPLAWPPVAPFWHWRQFRPRRPPPRQQARWTPIPYIQTPLSWSEEKIFEQYELATAYDDEIIRLSNIWSGESQRLYRQSLDADGNCSLSPQERWNLVTEMPECVEHNRLCNLQEPFLTRVV